MLTFADTPEELEKIAEESRGHLMKALSGLVPKQSDYRHKAGIPLFESGQNSEDCYLLRDGVYKVFCKKKMIRLYEAGDLIGFERHFGYSDCVVSSDFACKLDVYNTAELLEHIVKDESRFQAWQNFMSAQLYVNLGVAAVYAGEDIDMGLSIRVYQPGQTIIEEGTPPQEFFQMSQGSAEVFFEEKQIGTIGVDEIFGEVSFLLDEPRSATVTAKTICIVTAIQGEKFDFLAKNRPRTVFKIAQDLAKRLTKTNRMI